MRTSRILGMTLIFGILILNLPLTQIRTVEYTPGCEEGEWVKYRVTGNYTGFMDYTGMEWMRILNEAVSGQLVEVEQKIQYKNGTTKTFLWPNPVNVSNPMTPYIIAGGLNPGDIWDLGKNEIEINETIENTTTKRYAGKEYKVNYYSSDRNRNQPSVWKNVYWHSKAGLMLEGHLWYGGRTVTFKVIDIHLKGNTPLLDRYWPWIVGGILVVAILILLTVWRYRKED